MNYHKKFISEGYEDKNTLERRAQAMEAWLENPVLMEADDDAEYAAVIEIDLNEIAKLEKLEGEEINEAKVLLANSITELAHGKEKSRSAFNSAKEIMNKQVGISNLPSVNIDLSIIKDGIQIYKILTIENILCQSNSDARRLISQGAAKINGKKILDFNHLVTEKDVNEKKFIQLSIGKKKHAIINIVS